MFAIYKKDSFFRKYKIVSFTFLVFLCILFLSRCVSGSGAPEADIRGAIYAGSATCKSCHQKIYDSYIHAAHFNTSSASLPDSIQRAFEPGKNVFEFSDSIKVVMEKTDHQFYQLLYQNGHKIFSHPFDIVIGSGRKAQSYLYYDQTKILQLPISYFVTEHSWANSPGFPSNHPKFDRQIPTGCFGCHSSYIAVKQTYEGMQLHEDFEKGKMIYGIDCERCHGPAMQHVEYYKSHPGEKQVKLIANMQALNRTQKIDMCALCHSGVKDAQQSLFGFKPGDKLSDFYFPDFNMPDPDAMDVHGNQTQLIMASKCYRLSNDLTCNSCHNVHEKERDNIALLSKRCLNCHQEVKHNFTSSDASLAVITQNDCIDCHMPLTGSKRIALLTKQKTAARPDYIRTHLVRVYPEISQRFLDSIKQKAGRLN